MNICCLVFFASSFCSFCHCIHWPISTDKVTNYLSICAAMPYGWQKLTVHKNMLLLPSAFPSKLKTEAVCDPASVSNTLPTACCHNPQDAVSTIRCHKNLTFLKKTFRPLSYLPPNLSTSNSCHLLRLCYLLKHPTVLVTHCPTMKLNFAFFKTRPHSLNKQISCNGSAHECLPFTCEVVYKYSRNISKVKIMNGISLTKWTQKRVHNMQDENNVADLSVQGSGFGGLEVASCPLVPKFAGSNPA